jgi:hypothetical protein
VAKARSGRQCAKPAVSGKRVCRSHGGASCGPKTSAGIQKIREAHWKHGERSAVVIEKERISAIRLRQLADALGVLKAADGAKMRGRWPIGYQPLSTVKDVHDFVISELLQSD